MRGKALFLLAAITVSLCVPFGSVRGQDAEACMMCHGDASMFEGLENAELLAIDQGVYAATVHGEAGMTCVDCHLDLAGFEGYHDAELQPVDCGVCHADVQQVYLGSLHGYALQRDNPRAPTCSSCHTSHAIFRAIDPRSSTHEVRLPETCASCHGTERGLFTDEMVKLPESFQDYTDSVHGQGVERGIRAAAGCDDCHEVHDLKSSADPASPINHRNVSATCGQCHPTIQLAYDQSIHGRALQAGILDSPTCTDCHGEHLILSPRNSDSKTYINRLATETCGSCHDDPVIVRKYHLESGVVASYVDSYHGWAVQREHVDAATCVSCHTAHEVLPAVDPASTINEANVMATCQQCHPNVDENFAASYSHRAASLTLNPINRIIRNIYWILILGIIGGMVLHNLLIMNYYMIESRRAQESTAWVMRFDTAQIIQHLLLTVSFVMLVVTGFALRFPEAWWVQALTAAGMTEPVRATLHRVFAVMMVITALSHMWYIFLTARGREEFRAMLPAWVDIKDFIANIRFHTWRSRREVKFGRYDYSQKAEYWALIWGTILMILTGFILWFPGEVVKLLPAWVVTASQTIHYYEAWLATLAIIVWHFFFVIFHPEEYPMSWTWLTGKMSEHAVKKHHGRWYEEEIAAPTERREQRADTEI